MYVAGHAGNVVEANKSQDASVNPRLVTNCQASNVHPHGRPHLFQQDSCWLFHGCVSVLVIEVLLLQDRGCEIVYRLICDR